MSDSDSLAIRAVRQAMTLCPPEFAAHTALKGVWLAGFMRGYRFKQEEPADDRP